MNRVVSQLIDHLNQITREQLIALPKNRRQEIVDLVHNTLKSHDFFKADMELYQLIPQLQPSTVSKTNRCWQMVLFTISLLPKIIKSLANRVGLRIGSRNLHDLLTKTFVNDIRSFHESRQKHQKHIEELGAKPIEIAKVELQKILRKKQTVIGEDIEPLFQLDAAVFDVQKAAYQRIHQLKQKQLDGKEDASLEEMRQELEGQFHYMHANASRYGMHALIRMYWQNDKFLDFLQQPGAIQYLLSRPINDNETDATSAILYGVADMLPSYIFLVPANGSGESLLRVSKMKMRKFCGAYGAVIDFLGSNRNEETEKFINALQQCSSKQLHSMIKKLFTSANIDLFLKNASLTNRIRFYSETLEFSKRYWLSYRIESAVEALLHPEFSHGYDARHLAATIYQLDQQPDRIEKRFVTIFIEDIIEGHLGEDAEKLLRIRLKQIVFMMFQSREKLGLTTDFF